MPKIKQPTPLETLALRATVEWLCRIGKTIMPVIRRVSRSDAQRASDVLKLQIEVIHKIFEYNVPCYLYDKLSHEIFNRVPQLIDKVKQGLRSTAAMSDFLCQVNVAVSLSDVLISRYLRRLDFEEMPKVMRHLFYTKLKQLTGLHYLNLSSLSGGWKTCEMEPTVMNGITDMKHLTTLVLNYDCTDNILTLLASSCPKLHTLDISSSKSITNNSVKFLVDLENLRNVQTYRTSLTIEGYTRLLIKMPQLEDIGRYDEIGRCLEYVAMTYENYDVNERPKLKLKTFNSRYVTIKHLQLLAEWCPEITTVSVFHNPILNDLMLLIPIDKLSVLKLLSCDFFGDQVRDVLQVKGCNLTHLHFEHVDQIDMNALMYISQYCPDLKILTIYNCELIDSTSLYTRKLDIPPFMNLERLTIAAACSYQHIEFLLSTCFQIKYIHVGTMVPTNDALFDRVLCRNPMQHLEELRIVYSSGLSIAMAYKLLDVCANLTVLSELESWTSIKELELECFKMFIAARNYDLNIKPLTIFKTEEEE